MVLSKIKPLYLFLLVVFLSLIFRITNLDLIEFKIDEASNLLLATRLMFGHPLPYGGITSSVGILNPPLFNYILIPFTLISLDPKVIVAIIALINSLAIGLFFLIIKKYYNTALALIASLILAFSPWLIIFSRKIWPPDLIFPFSVLLFFSIHKIIIEKKIVFWITFVLSSLFLIQLDLSSAFFILLISAFLVIQKPQLNWKYIMIGLVLGILPMLPYLVYEFKNSCPDCLLLLTFNKQLDIRSPEVFIRSLQILNQGNFKFILRNDTLTFFTNYPFVYQLKSIFYIEYLLIPIGMLLFWMKNKDLRFIVYAILGLPILYFIFRLGSFMHYYVILVPFLCLFLSISFYALIKSKNYTLRYGSIGILLTVIIYSIIFNFYLFVIIRKQSGLNGDYGASFNKTLPYVEQQIVEYKNRKDYQEILLSSYIDVSAMRGISPFAIMIYPPKETEKNLKAIEERLKNDPNDPRILQELLVYYTSQKITRPYVDYIKKKITISPAYEIIYNEVNHLYNASQY
ncbi:MAG: hypothetical protein Q7R31_02645 [Candidatus Levybacteria bacterium]|nr:hypothetical protein [Candidatus Levybacteria bacterium]